MKMWILTTLLALSSLAVTGTAIAGEEDCPWASYVNFNTGLVWEYACSDQHTNDPVGYIPYCAGRFVNEGAHLDYLLVWCTTKML